MGSDESQIGGASSRWPLLALWAITLAGLALRLTNVGESLWLDELHSGWVVRDAWSDVSWRAQIGNQGPVWFYAVKLVTTLGGESELTLRLLSLFAGTALIPVMYLLVCQWLAGANAPTSFSPASDLGSVFTSRSALPGLFAASLIAVDPNGIFYATEARPYACLQLCAAVQLGLFWQILRRPTTKLRIGWILLTALAFHLHYTGILILLGELVVLLGYYLLSRKPVPYRPWRALFDWQLAAMLCLPATGHVLEIARRREMWDRITEKPAWDKLLEIFPLYPVTALGLVLYPIIALAIVVGILGVAQWYQGRAVAKPHASWRGILVVSSWLILPLLAAFAVTEYELARVFFRRYLIAFAIGPTLLMALLLTRLPQYWLQGAVAAMVLSLAVYHSNIVPQLRYDGRAVGDRNEDWRGAIAWLSKQYAQSPERIELYSGLLEETEEVQRRLVAEGKYSQLQVREYLRFPLTSLYASPAEHADIDNMGASLDRKWTVWRGPPRGTSCILDACDRATMGYDLVQERSFGNVHVSQWER